MLFAQSSGFHTPPYPEMSVLCPFYVCNVWCMYVFGVCETPLTLTAREQDNNNKREVGAFKTSRAVEKVTHRSLFT